MASFDLLHFDTNDQNSLFTENNCYDTTFTLTNAYRRIRKINLASLEMPIVFTNIRNENTSNILQISIDGVNHRIVLDNKNYTDIQDLINDINDSFDLILVCMNMYEHVGTIEHAAYLCCLCVVCARV